MRYLLFFALMLTAVAGCQPAPPQTIPVTGLVTLDGVPCAAAAVTFIPFGETQGNGGVGYTDAEGKFTAHLHDGQTGKGPAGLLPGKYKVVISKWQNPDGTPGDRNVAPIDSTAREVLPAAYSDYEQTKLQLEVGLASLQEKYELKSGK